MIIAYELYKMDNAGLIPQQLQKWTQNIALIIGGIVLAIGIVVLVAPTVLPDDRLQAADTVMAAQYTVGDGDILAIQYDTIRPLTDPSEVLSSHQLAWDADGFRIPAEPAASYEVLAIGDSFTEAANVARPWSDVLAETSGLSVRNLGFRGYGTQQYAQVMTRYGSNTDADVVIVGFFGGNDVFSAGIENNDFVIPALAENLENLFNDDADPWKPARQGDFQYPMFINTEEMSQPIAFLNGYLAWINIKQETLRASLNYERIVQHLTQIATTAGDDTCLILAYFPPKVEVYMPYLRTGDRFPLIDGHAEIVLDEPGGLLRKQTDPDISFEKVLENRRNTAEVILAAGRNAGYRTLDLWTAFDAAASEGKMLYYTYDTHWNQAGHDLAGAQIAEFIAANCETSR